jgi:hypothetical protein
MASDDVGEAIGVVLLIGLIIVAVVVGVVIVLAAGSLIGSGVGFVNYCKSFHANVRLERPGV